MAPASRILVEVEELEILLVQVTWVKPFVQLPLSLIGSFKLNEQHEKALSLILQSQRIYPVLTDVLSTHSYLLKKEGRRTWAPLSG